MNSVSGSRHRRNTQLEIRAMQDSDVSVHPQAVPKDFGQLDHLAHYLRVGGQRYSHDISQVGLGRTAGENSFVAVKYVAPGDSRAAPGLGVPFKQKPGMILHNPGADS